MLNNGKEILLTVVVPFFNAASTITACAKSLLPHKSGAVEVIFVDDGSADGSADVLLGVFPEAMVVRHEANRGTAAALTTGYRAAHGDYLLRCDADDYIDGNLLDAIVGLIVERHPDIVEFAMRTHEKGKVKEEMPSGNGDLNDMALSTVNFSLCNHAVRRELILDALPYEALNCWEDLSVMARILSRQPSVARIDGPAYNYVRPDSPTSLSVADHSVILRDRVGVAERIDAYFTENGLAENFRPFLDRVKFSAKARYMAHGMRDRRAWKTTFPEVNSRIMRLSHIRLRHKLMFAILSLIP